MWWPGQEDGNADSVLRETGRKKKIGEVRRPGSVGWRRSGEEPSVRNARER